MTASTILLIIAGLLLVGTPIAIFILKKGKKELEMEANPNIIHNYLAHLVSEDGHKYFQGAETRRIEGIHGRVGIWYIPTDGNTEKDDEIKEVFVVADKNKLLIDPKGSKSRYRNIITILPNDPVELEYYNLSDDNPLKKAYQKVIVQKNVENTVIEMMQNGQKITKEIALKLGVKALTPIHKNLDNEFIQDMASKIMKLQEGQSK